MMTLREYATKWRRPHDNNFALACYAQSTLSELGQAGNQPADAADMRAWGITEPQEWHDAIAAALAARLDV